MFVNCFGKKIKIFRGDREPGSGALGRSIHGDSEIWIWNNLKGDNFESILIHEILHQIDFELNLDLTEQQISGLGTALFSLGFKIKCEKDEDE